jgi:hypothetical protein
MAIAVPLFFSVFRLFFIKTLDISVIYCITIMLEYFFIRVVWKLHFPNNFRLKNVVL